jgi:long-chain acyl-CoA synthetase
METLIELVADAAARYGDRVALMMKPGIRMQAWRYDELLPAAARVAGMLLRRGVGKGDTVVLWGPNSPEWVLAFLGCLRLGAVAVPLDLACSPAFAKLVEAGTQPKLRFVSRLTPPRAGLARVPEVSLDTLWHDLPEHAEADLPAPPRGGDLAQVVFTSGTTGDPKGVMLSHRGTTANVLAVSRTLDQRRPHKLLSLLPLSHTFEQTVGLLTPLHHGWTILYPTSRQPTVIFRMLAENRVTALVTVPQALGLFWGAIERQVRQGGRERTFGRMLAIAPRLPRWARRLAFRSLHRRLGGRLRLLIAGGAYLDPALARKWEAVGVQVAQGYGTTETSPIIACLRIGDRNLRSVGKGLPGQELRVAADGEIQTRGPHLMLGYWNKPEATAASFTADGWYRTGDLGELDGDGYLYLRGRKKYLIVLADGRNVFPEDLEAILDRQPGVKEAVVVGRPRGDEVEVHAVVLAADPEAGRAAVAAANAQLADFQRVRGHTLWPGEDLPRTHTLKVKREEVVKYLAELEAGRAGAVAPRTALPETVEPLLRILGEISGLPTDAIDGPKELGDDLGLDSLHRVELLSAVEAELGVYIDDSAIGPDTTVAELRERLAASGQRGRMRFPEWALTMPARVARFALQQGAIFPLVHLYHRVEADGYANLEGLKGPVIFAGNHHAHFDVIVVPMKMPLRFRHHMAIVAAADLVTSPIRALVGELGANGFPFDPYNGLRPSMEYLGKLLDAGWNILIFPEGHQHKGGPLYPFEAGTGLIATEAATPVVPFGMQVIRPGKTEGATDHFRTHLRVHFGKPLIFPRGTTPAEATAAIEQAVLDLVPGLRRATPEEVSAVNHGPTPPVAQGAPVREGRRA